MSLSIPIVNTVIAIESVVVKHVNSKLTKDGCVN